MLRSVAGETRTGLVRCGLGAAGPFRNILERSGVEAAGTNSGGNASTTGNLEKATCNALSNAAQSRTPRHARQVHYDGVSE